MYMVQCHHGDLVCIGQANEAPYYMYMYVCLGYWHLDIGIPHRRVRVQYKAGGGSW